MQKNKIIKKVIEISQKAGDHAKNNFCEDGYKYESKSQTQDVTKIDKECEEIILSELKKISDEFKIISEEDINSHNQEIIDDEYYWIVDPLDGTTNFRSGIKNFANQIALVQNNNVILGCIYLPFENKVLHAIENQGSYCNDSQLNINHVHTTGNSLMNLESYLDEYDLKNLEKIRKEFKYVYSINSAVSSFAHFALGKTHLVYSCCDQPWDVAAGILIAKEAGATISTPDNQDIDLFNPKIIASSSKELHEKVIELLKK